MDLWDDSLVCEQCGGTMRRDQPRLISLEGYRIGEPAPEVPLYALHGDCLKEWVARDRGKPGGGAPQGRDADTSASFLGGALAEDGEI
jgi:hypothetical protein